MLNRVDAPAHAAGRAHVALRCLMAAVLACCLAGAVRAEQAVASAQTTESRERGAQVYQSVCVACHEGQADSRAPAKAVLGLMSPDSILQALTGGMMKEVGAALNDEQKRNVAQYLTGRAFGQANTPPKRCDRAHARFDPRQPPSFSAWGIDAANSHHVPAAVGGLDSGNVAALSLQWALAFPNAVRARSQPAVGAGAVFVGSHDGTVYALDRETGCARWTFKARAEVRTGIVMAPWPRGRAPATALLYFGDLVGHVYALNAFTGQLVWSDKVDAHSTTTLTAAPAWHDGRLYVPVSSLEEATRSDARPCCTFRGSVVAYDARRGQRLWQTYMVGTPVETGNTDKGIKTWGPSGAAIWNTPTVDAKRRRLYLGTGDNYSPPATATSDAIVALDMDSGRIIWTRQTVAGDIWPGDGPDSDWGAPPVLARDSTGREWLVAGQKSGVVFGIQPEDGQVIWQTKVGRGGIGGGVQFGLALQGDRVFVPIHDRNDGRNYPDPKRPGLYALDIRDGSLIWQAPHPDSCGDKTACYPGYAGAITVTGDLVLAGSIDGFIRAYHVANGQLLWQLDTARDFSTVNGETARGGSMGGGAAPIAVAGMLFMNSGYAAFNSTQKAGNVFLAFKVPTGERR